MSKRVKLTSITLGCPKWDLPTIVSRYKEYGFDGIDFRVINGNLKLLEAPEFTSGLKDTKKRIADSGLEVSQFSTSIQVCDPNRRQVNLDEAKAYIALAKEFGTNNLRVFGEGPVEKEGHEKCATIGREFIQEMLQLDGASDLFWNFETHDYWTTSKEVKSILDGVPKKNFRVLWDISHTCHYGKEKPEHTFAQYGDRCGYTHIKDARHEPNHPKAGKDGWRYVTPGTGEIPLQDTLELLLKKGFSGWFAFEHEKHWVPTLEEPEEAFPAFVKWLKPILAKHNV